MVKSRNMNWALDPRRPKAIKSTAATTAKSETTEADKEA